ncbi:MAG TPA: hypothetical protein VKB45_20020 [Gemmatimonadales bacterium]|nr:hypothetical protein [Gemmatimonadales bacterium]
MSVPTWLRAMLLAGLLYLVIGIATSDLARLSGQVWRLVAWVASLVVFVVHIAYDRDRLRNAPATAAFHAALAVAVGAFGLALAATLRAVAAGNYRGAYALALVAWPVMLGAAAFVAAWGGAVIARGLLRR